MKYRWQYPVVLSAAATLTGCSEDIVNAGYNTLLGMGMAFFVLIIISLVISLLPLISKLQEGRKDDQKMRMDAIDKTVGQIAQKEDRVTAPVAPAPASDDAELIAVMAAAIAAYEADKQGVPAGAAYASDTYVDDYDPDRDYGNYRVRPVRRVRQSQAWKKA